MRGAARWVTTATVVAVTAGCSGGGGSAPTAQVLDSAGIRIVTYDLTDVTVPTYRSVAEHDLQIGVLDGAPEYTFSRIPDLAVTGDGSINVLDLVAMLLCFGDPATPPCDMGTDINQDGVINVLDLIELLLAFGDACP